MRRHYSNTAVPVVLTADVNDTATVIPVSSTAGYPAFPFLGAFEKGTANEEIALVTAGDAASFTVTRGFDGTTRKAHAATSQFEHVVASIDYDEANLNINLGDIIPYAREGTLTVAPGKGRFGPLPYPITILGVFASANTPPQGQAIILDLNRILAASPNAPVTVFTTQPNRPQILANAYATAAEVLPDIVDIAAGSWLTWDVDQVGSTVAGADLQAFVRYRRVP